MQIRHITNVWDRYSAPRNTRMGIHFAQSTWMHFPFEGRLASSDLEFFQNLYSFLQAFAEAPQLRQIYTDAKSDSAKLTLLFQYFTMMSAQEDNQAKAQVETALSLFYSDDLALVLRDDPEQPTQWLIQNAKIIQYLSQRFEVLYLTDGQFRDQMDQLMHANQFLAVVMPLVREG